MSVAVGDRTSAQRIERGAIHRPKLL